MRNSHGKNEVLTLYSALTMNIDSHKAGLYTPCNISYSFSFYC